MKYNFCTITTISHLYKTRALICSVKKLIDATFYVMVVDGKIPVFDDATYLDLSFFKSEIGLTILKKYKDKPDKLRWALKPVFLSALLAEHCDKIIYTDNDICFFSSPSFLFDKLSESNVLLTPHNYSFDSTKNQIWFEANFWVGLYNAGFIAASKKGLPALNWWAQCCAYNVKRAPWRGLFDDQKYLDLMPVVFENVEVLKHKGCNVAGWNLENNIRIKNSEIVVIDPDFPIVFIHFTKLFFQNIKNGKDDLLRSYCDEYVALLTQFNPSFRLSSQLKNKWPDYYLFLRFCFWRLIRIIE